MELINSRIGRNSGADKTQPGSMSGLGVTVSGAIPIKTLCLDRLSTVKWYLVLVLLLCNTPVLSYAYSLPDTGQTACFSASGANIPCAGTGQDAEYSINPMSFTDNGNGTVTDNNTGLIWQQGENGVTYNWYKASGTYDATYNPGSINACGSLVLAGYSDWRLPSKKELYSLVDYSIAWPGPAIRKAYFPNARGDYYWTSTPGAAGISYGAWFVYFGDGTLSGYYKDFQYYVRCVRN